MNKKSGKKNIVKRIVVIESKNLRKPCQFFLSQTLTDVV